LSLLNDSILHYLAARAFCIVIWCHLTRRKPYHGIITTKWLISKWWDGAAFLWLGEWVSFRSSVKYRSMDRIVIRSYIKRNYHLLN